MSALTLNKPPQALADPRMMTPEQLAMLLPKLDLVEDWIKLVRECAHAAAEHGVVIPGYKLVMKRGRRQWIDEDRHIIAALHEIGLSDEAIVEISLRSPAQIEKKLPKEKRGIVALYAQMISSGTTLASDDDVRPPVPSQGFTAFPELPAAPAASLKTEETKDGATKPDGSG